MQTDLRELIPDRYARIPGLLIALHSPSTLPETGLRICPPEKSRDSDPDLR
jgi:hypothetical protein